MVGAAVVVVSGGAVVVTGAAVVSGAAVVVAGAAVVATAVVVVDSVAADVTDVVVSSVSEHAAKRIAIDAQTMTIGYFFMVVTLPAIRQTRGSDLDQTTGAFSNDSRPKFSPGKLAIAVSARCDPNNFKTTRPQHIARLFGDDGS